MVFVSVWIVDLPTPLVGVIRSTFGRLPLIPRISYVAVALVGQMVANVSSTLRRNRMRVSERSALIDHFEAGIDAVWMPCRSHVSVFARAIPGLAAERHSDYVCRDERHGV